MSSMTHMQNQLVARDELQLGENGYTSLILPSSNFSLVDKVGCLLGSARSWLAAQTHLISGFELPLSCMHMLTQVTWNVYGGQMDWLTDSYGRPLSCAPWQAQLMFDNICLDIFPQPPPPPPA